MTEWYSLPPGSPERERMKRETEGRQSRIVATHPSGMIEFQDSSGRRWLKYGEVELPVKSDAWLQFWLVALPAQIEVHKRIDVELLPGGLLKLRDTGCNAETIVSARASSIRRGLIDLKKQWRQYRYPEQHGSQSSGDAATDHNFVPESMR